MHQLLRYTPPWRPVAGQGTLAWVTRPRCSAPASGTTSAADMQLTSHNLTSCFKCTRSWRPGLVGGDGCVGIDELGRILAVLLHLALVSSLATCGLEA